MMAKRIVEGVVKEKRERETTSIHSAMMLMATTDQCRGAPSLPSMSASDLLQLQ